MGKFTSRKSTSYRLTRLHDRVLWIDIVKIISIFFVIVIHVIGSVISYVDTVSTHWYTAIIFYQSLSIISIPLFIMASGYLVLEKNESYSVFFKKRVKRIILPWVGWTIIYFVWTVVNRVESVNDIYGALFLLGNIFYNYFWFLPMIAGIYVLTPIIRKYVILATNTDLLYAICLWFIVFSVIFFFQRYFNVLIVPDLRDLLILLPIPYMGYFLLGYIIKKFIHKKISLLSILFIYLFGLSATFFGTREFNFTKNLLDISFLDFLAPNIVIQSVAFFCLFAYTQRKRNIFLRLPFRRFIVSLSNATLGIYLSNRLITQIYSQEFFGFRLNILNFSPLFSIPFISLVIFFVSYLLVFCLQKIPFIKHFIG